MSTLSAEKIQTLGSFLSGCTYYPAQTGQSITAKELTVMTKGFMKFAKGMGIGLAVGCVAGAVANQYMYSGNKGMKKTVTKALHNISDLSEEMGSMF